MRSLLLMSALAMMLGLTSCNSFIERIGPVEKDTVVVLYPGKVCQVVENVTVKVKAQGANGFTDQDIGGWIVMPPQHFNALMLRLKQFQEKNKQPEGPNTHL